MNTLSIALPARTPAADAPIGLLVAVALVSALAGAGVTLAVWQQLGPDRPAAPIVQAAPVAPVLAVAPPAAPSMHEALRGREDPPTEPVPTF